MTSYTTNTEFIARELHTLVIDAALYDWDEVWRYLCDHDAILEDPEFETFSWNPESVYMQATGMLYNLLDCNALDCLSIEKRYVEGEIWTRRTTFNAVTGRTRRVAYATDVHDLVVVYATDGTRQATVGQLHNGKYLRDPEVAWSRAEVVWNCA